MLALQLKRWYWRWKTRGNPQGESLASLWSNEKLNGKQSWQDVEFLVVDTETSGLNPNEGEILSIGWVVIKNGRVHLETAEHHLLKPEGDVGDSATIHQIRDCELDAGWTHHEMLDHLLDIAKDKVLVFHHAPLDMAFLNHYAKLHFGMPLLLPVADTLQIEKNLLEKKQTPLGQSVLRLASCRIRYNLPPYPAHNALVDALATAELLLAQIAYRCNKLRVKDLLSPVI